MKYAIVPHLLATIFTILSYRWIITFFPFMYDQRTFTVPILSVLWFIVIYKGIKWTGKHLDELDDHLFVDRKPPNP